MVFFGHVMCLMCYGIRCCLCVRMCCINNSWPPQNSVPYNQLSVQNINGDAAATSHYTAIICFYYGLRAGVELMMVCVRWPLCPLLFNLVFSNAWPNDRILIRAIPVFVLCNKMKGILCRSTLVICFSPLDAKSNEVIQ